MIMAKISASEQKIGRASADDFALLIEQISPADSNFVLIDIRTKAEYNAGHIPSAIQMDFYAKDFPQKLDKLARDKVYLIYCRSGNRTGHTLRLMQKMNFQQVIDLKNGIISWQNSGKKLVK